MMLTFTTRRRIGDPTPLCRPGQRGAIRQCATKPTLVVAAFLFIVTASATSQPGGVLTTLRISNDYIAGTRDRDGVFMGGTEMMALAGYNGALYAAVGYGQDVRGADPKTGGQVLRKDAPTGAWIVDAQFDTTVLRTECLLPLTFTRDGSGRHLSPPFRVLAAGPLGAGLHRRPGVGIEVQPRVIRAQARPVRPLGAGQHAGPRAGHESQESRLRRE